jgi:hypothetical protein
MTRTLAIVAIVLASTLAPSAGIVDHVRRRTLPGLGGVESGAFLVARVELSLALQHKISVPSGDTAVLEHFQARMPYGLVVPDMDRPPDDG